MQGSQIDTFLSPYVSGNGYKLLIIEQYKLNTGGADANVSKKKINK